MLVYVASCKMAWVVPHSYQPDGLDDGHDASCGPYVGTFSCNILACRC